MDSDNLGKQKKKSAVIIFFNFKVWSGKKYIEQAMYDGSEQLII